MGRLERLLDRWARWGHLPHQPRWSPMMNCVRDRPGAGEIHRLAFAMRASMSCLSATYVTNASFDCDCPACRYYHHLRERRIRSTWLGTGRSCGDCQCIAARKVRMKPLVGPEVCWERRRELTNVKITKNGFTFFVWHATQAGRRVVGRTRSLTPPGLALRRTTCSIPPASSRLPEVRSVMNMVSVV